ncbi:MAG: hypothetical protein EZS28_036219 [Streblomastix strix]|uniref:Reverse transcriptase domain-containing protein n=1 Tax=Streblomastix strix TaxID=222440 RepID=A0A5J4UFB6_9EUKA|nr:MAG: hypothetical protein EZS28_036219 [Streblomastix strix]
MHDSNEVKQTIRLGDWGPSLDLSSAFHHLIVQKESQPYLAFEFQNNTSPFINIMDHQKAQTTRLKGWNITMIMNKTAILDINCWIEKLRANIPAQLIQIPPQMTTTTDAAPSG